MKAEVGNELPTEGDREEQGRTKLRVEAHDQTSTTEPT